MELQPKMEHHTALVDGSRVSYTARGPVNATHAYVGINGLMGGGDSFWPVIAGVPQDWRVVLPDLPGCGESEPMQPPRKHSVDGYVNWLSDFASEANLNDKKLVLASVTYNSGGLYPELLAGIDLATPEDLAGTPFYEEYTRIAPHPEDFPRLFARQQELDREQQNWPAEAIRAITAPALLIIGDSDIVRPEHTVELFRLLGGGVAGDLVGLPRSQLAVLPGTTHVTLVERASWLVSMVNRFLDLPMPAAR